MKTIKTLLADDHTIVREGLRALLLADPGIEVVGEARNGREAVEMAASLHPDVVVMDIAMPLLNGLEATRQILAAIPGHEGAHPFRPQRRRLHRPGDRRRSRRVPDQADLGPDPGEGDPRGHGGKRVLQPAGLEAPARPLSQAGEDRGPGRSRRPPGLTSRELEVIQLVAEGQANKQVAAELKISIKTVEKHRQHLMDKLNIHDTAGLTRYAIAQGIIESSVQVTIV